MKPARVVVCLAMASGLAGCALVSGLSSLDVGEGTTVADASVDRRPDVATVDASTVDVVVDAAGEAEAGPVDAGIDAPSCGALLGGSATFATACTGVNPVFNNGALTPGSYELYALRDYGGNCGSFVSQQVAGRLVITNLGQKYRLDELIVTNGVPEARSWEAVVNGSALDVTQLCGTPVNDKSWGINVVPPTDGGVGTLLYFKDDGVKQLRYYWH